MVQYKYDAWGAIIYQTPNQPVGDANPFRYRSYYFDSETGWYYLQSRYYDPLLGRFISADGLAGQIGNPLNHNMYAYCANNPVLYSRISNNNYSSDDESAQSAYYIRFDKGVNSSQSTITNLQNDNWFNGNCEYTTCNGNIYQTFNDKWRFSFGEGKASLFNFTQKHFRILHLQVDIARVEYSVNDWTFHTTLGTAKGILAFNSFDGFGMEAKLVLLTIGAKGDIIGVNFDIVAVGFTAKCQAGTCEFGASALFGFTVSINVEELYYWIRSIEGAQSNVYIN